MNQKKPTGLPVFLIIGLPFLVVGITTVNTFLYVGGVFTFIGLLELASRKNWSERTGEETKASKDASNQSTNSPDD